MKLTKKKKDDSEKSLSRVKVPHIGPRPRSIKPGGGSREENEKKRTTRSARKK